MIQYFIIIIIIIIFYLIKNNFFNIKENLENKSNNCYCADKSESNFKSDNYTSNPLNNSSYIANTLYVQGSPAEVLEKYNEFNYNEEDRNSEFFSNAQFITNNNINYALLESTLDLLEQQYNYIKNNIENIKINIQSNTGKNPNDEPDIKVTGSFPSDILFSINFPSCLPGKIGEKGQSGTNGEKGTSGLQGERGPTGPFGLCPA